MTMRRLALTLTVTVIATATWAAAPTRLKELVEVQGSRDNALIGYGLVVGLTNTGDSEQVLFTMQSVSSVLGRFGVRVDPRDIRSRNVAAVMVTAKLPTFSRPGSTLDVTVSAMGNARSLQGGTLLMTPLSGPDGQTYALAQGPVQVGGFEVNGGIAAIRKNTPTAGSIPAGATVERAVTPSLTTGTLVLRLKRPDFTNATRISSAIDKAMGAPTAAESRALAAVELKISDADKDDPVALLAKLEAVEIDADVRAKIVVSERTGTVVMGENVRLRPAAISHGGLRVAINSQFAVSQPAPFGAGQTIVVPNQQASAIEQQRSAVAVPATSTVDDLVKALNGIGASSRDLVAILQALKAAGALDAELEVL